MQLKATPQPPQFVASLFVSVSQPSRTAFSSTLQSAQPALQLIAHWPPEQLANPCALLQTEPQAPQLFASVFVLVSHPSRLKFSLALQSA